MTTRKLKLDLGELHVESFAPVAAESVRGTVQGQMTEPLCSYNTVCFYTCNCPNDSVEGYESCGTTCQEPTACYGYCTNETCVESNFWSCGCPAATTPQAGCPIE